MPRMDGLTIGDRLARARRQAGLSQAEAGTKAGVSRQRISAIESAGDSLHWYTIQRLASIYGVPTHQITEGTAA